jgi:hypothetical protein
METEKQLALLVQAVHEGIASTTWLILVLSLCMSGLGAFFGGYLAKRAEHLATKEDFDDLLSQLKAQTTATEQIRDDFIRPLEAFKSGLLEAVEARTQVILPRVAAYQKLWSATLKLRPTAEEELTPKEKSDLASAITLWYYEEGNGLFLSLEGGRLFRVARSHLLNERSTSDTIREAFSSLRTQMKLDLKVYGEADKEVDLGT